jgi:hypothetical protein
MKTVRRTLRTHLPLDALRREVLDLGWLGNDVRVDLRPGGLGSLVDDDGIARQIVIDELHEHGLSFRWWPADGPVSDVVLTITTDGDGSRLTVTEAPRDRHLDASAKGRHWDLRLQALADRCGQLVGV